jgi:hypothetical protein
MDKAQGFNNRHMSVTLSDVSKSDMAYPRTYSLFTLVRAWVWPKSPLLIDLSSTLNLSRIVHLSHAMLNLLLTSLAFLVTQFP